MLMPSNHDHPSMKWKPAVPMPIRSTSVRAKTRKFRRALIDVADCNLATVLGTSYEVPDSKGCEYRKEKALRNGGLDGCAWVSESEPVSLRTSAGPCCGG